MAAHNYMVRAILSKPPVRMTVAAHSSKIFHSSPAAVREALAPGGGGADLRDAGGGRATRLTESACHRGMEAGDRAVPPLDAAGWQAEFAKYQAIRISRAQRRHEPGRVQDHLLWEWSHRLLAGSSVAHSCCRSVFLLAGKWIEPRMRARL